LIGGKKLLLLELQTLPRHLFAPIPASADRVLINLDQRASTGWGVDRMGQWRTMAPCRADIGPEGRDNPDAGL
jgi:hypothetical protein